MGVKLDAVLKIQRNVKQGGLRPRSQRDEPAPSLFSPAGAGRGGAAGQRAVLVCATATIRIKSG
jgi:hypothetical protein